LTADKAYLLIKPQFRRATERLLIPAPH
jgi:hypothetical protein